jgi:hypothetical protein
MVTCHLLVSSSREAMPISSFTVLTAHALIGHEHSARTPRQEAVPQSHSRTEPSREQAV